MTRTLTLPPLTAIPEDIEEQLRHLLLAPADPALEGWLVELIKGSGHLSTPDNLRWRLISIIWLAAEFNVDKAWPYLMWLNMGEPVISAHLAEILAEAADDLDCQVRLANWIAQAGDARLVTFFSDFRHVPARYKLPGLLSRLLVQPTSPEVGVWLAAYCRDTANHANPALRPWRLFTAAWYATCFDPAAGLAYLDEFSQGQPTLSPADNKLLLDTAHELNGVTPLIQWVAACPDAAVKTMLKDFGRPDLAALTAAIFQAPPNYTHLAGLAGQAEQDAQTFQRNMALLEKTEATLKDVKILDLACGPLAAQTLLFNSAGYPTVGADLHIPPAYLPRSSFKQWLKRGQYVKAWQAATAPYYQALARHAGLKLNWRKVKIELADLARLPFAEHSFEVAICINHLQHAPDVESLLAEAARVLKSEGWLVADIRPYSALTGAFPATESLAWQHLRRPTELPPPNPTLILNRWREAQYQAAFEKYFTIEQWLTEQDSQALTQLTPAIRAELADYDEAELTRKQVVVLARVCPGF